jgi:hypothetical protein
MKKMENSPAAYFPEYRISLLVSRFGKHVYKSEGKLLKNILEVRN